MRYDWEPTYCECEIDGVRIHYDGCDSNSLENALKFYKDWDYIGSNDGVIYIDGVRNDFKSKHYFFRKSSLKEQRVKKLNKIKKSNDIL